MALASINTVYCFDEVTLDCCGCFEVMGSYVPMELVREEVWAWDVGHAGCYLEEEDIFFNCVVGYADNGWLQAEPTTGRCLDLMTIGPPTLTTKQHVWVNIVAVDATGNRSTDPCPPCPETCPPRETQ
jgi:hypothetical protein